jgi:hypothetical protein
MMRNIWVPMCFLAPLAVMAQGIMPPPSSHEQALSNKLITEINTSLQCSAALIDAQARIKELEAKQSDKP